MISLLETILIKSRVGRYKDNAINRRLHRVGQPYGNKKEDDNNDKEATKVHNNAHRQSRRLPEFENLYKSCEELSDEQVRGFRTGQRELSEEEFSSLGGILGRQIASVSNSNRVITSFTVKHAKSGNEFNMQSVDGNTFRDCFSIVRKFLPNGDAVDIHDNYDDCKCYISSDGLSGFAIEEDGNLVSVFSLKNGFLSACGQKMVELGAIKLDCYRSNKQNLPAIYEHCLGFKLLAECEYSRDIMLQFNSKEYVDYFEQHYGNANVIMMGLAPNFTGKPEMFKGETGYDDAMAHRDKMLKDNGG